MTNPDLLPQRIDAVRKIISEACERSGRNPQDIRLIGVTKTRPASVCAAAHKAGLLDLGENYVQEWDSKATSMTALTPPIRWHMIGRLQSNKIPLLVGRTALIHTVDRWKLMEALQRHAERSETKVDILLQVNIAGEEQKGGCNPADALQLVQESFGLSHVQVRGFMTIAPLSTSPEAVRPIFRELRHLLEDIRTHAPTDRKERLTELSMGMSSDLAVAVEEGATLVRVGSAIFGHRT